MSDTPNTKVKKLLSLEKYINICKDFYAGSMKVLNETYLPKWTGETPEGYNARIAQTAFANMFAPVIDGLAGIITRKPPVVEGYRNTDNVDLKYNSIEVYIKDTIKKSMTAGLVFVSVETNVELNRAYFKRYAYEELYSYFIEDGIVKQLVFREIVEIKDGKFGIIEQERFVVFKIGGGDVWYKAEGNTQTMKVQTSWANNLKEIPVLAVITGKVISPFEVLPKLLDIANLNKVHLNLESNLANVLGVVGNPVPVFFGKTEEGKVTLGVKDALVFEDKQTQGFQWVEIEGKSIGSLQSKITAVEAQIDKLTFNMLTSQDSKTVIDAQEKQSKNTSFLSDVAREVEDKFVKLFDYMAQLENVAVPAGAKLELEKEFDLMLLDIEVAFKMLQAGDMSRQTFYEVWKTGRLPKDFDITKENEQIETDA